MTSDMTSQGKRPAAQVTLVIGKGGVGKTSVAAGLAVAAARTRGSALLVEFMDGKSGTRVLSSLAQPVAVEQVVVRPHVAIEELSTTLFRSQLVARFVTGNFAMKKLFRAAPALRELAQLEVIRELADARPTTPVIVDMPATGHGLAWLRVARQLDTLLVSGPLQKVAQRLNRQFLVPSRTRVALVTLPEPLVLQETAELAVSMRQSIDLPPEHVVVNRMPAEVDDSVIAEVTSLADGATAEGTAAATLLKVLIARRDARAEAAAELAQASFGGARQTVLPYLPVDPTVDQLAGWLTDAGVA